MSFNFFKKKIVKNEIEQTIDAKETVDILLRYCYEWNEDVPENERNTKDHPSRFFCTKMIELNRFYSRADIESMSKKLGYSVWDHRGGDGCRHRWVAKTVVKKD
jgi:hypothetical protein